MATKSGDFAEQPDEQVAHTPAKPPVFATIGRCSMARVHLARTVETPVWSGSPQGVVCFTTSSPSAKGAFGNRKSSKRWSFYGGSSGNKKNRRGDSTSHQSASSNGIANQQKKSTKPHDRGRGATIGGAGGNAKCPAPPPPLRLASEPEDITDRLYLRRRWTSNESFKQPLNVFEPQGCEGGGLGEAKKLPIWKAANGDTTNFDDDPVLPLSSQSLMYSWKGDECPPDVPDSRQILPDDPVSALMRSPKPIRSFSVESTESSSNSSTISNTRSLSLRRTNRPSLLGPYLESSEASIDSCGNGRASSTSSVNRLATTRRRPSLRKVELPKLEGDLPSLEQVKAQLLEEARNMPDTVRLIPLTPRPSSSQDHCRTGGALSLAKRVGAASSISNLLAKLSGGGTSNVGTDSPDRKHKVISAPVVQTMFQLRRNHSLGSHDLRVGDLPPKPAIPPKPVIHNGKVNRSNSEKRVTTTGHSTTTGRNGPITAAVRPADGPPGRPSVAAHSKNTNRNSLCSSSSADSQCSALSTATATSVSSCCNDAHSGGQPLSTICVSFTGRVQDAEFFCDADADTGDSQQRPVDIRHDIDDALIMDLLKNLNINANEKDWLRRASKQRQCECISPPPAIHELTPVRDGGAHSGHDTAESGSGRQRTTHDQLIVAASGDGHCPSGDVTLTNSENELEAQEYAEDDYADGCSTQQPSYDPSVSSSDSGIGSELSLDKGVRNFKSSSLSSSTFA